MSQRTSNNPRRRTIGSGWLARMLSAPLRIAGVAALRLAIPIGALCALSAAGMLVYSLIEGAWLIASFEIVVVAAGVVAMLAGTGRFREGPALALLCAGGTIGSLAVLAEPALVSRFLGTVGTPIVIGGFNILPLMAGRAVGGMILAASAALVVWGRDGSRSAGYLVRGGLAGGAALMIVVLGVWKEPSGGARSGLLGILDHAAAMLGALPLLVQVLLVIVAFFLVVGLVSAGGHCVIRSFEVGRLEEGGSEKGRAGDARRGGNPANPASA